METDAAAFMKVDRMELQLLQKYNVKDARQTTQHYR